MEIGQPGGVTRWSRAMFRRTPTITQAKPVDVTSKATQIAPTNRGRPELCLTCEVYTARPMLRGTGGRHNRLVEHGREIPRAAREDEAGESLVDGWGIGEIWCHRFNRTAAPELGQEIRPAAKHPRPWCPVRKSVR